MNPVINVMCATAICCAIIGYRTTMLILLAVAAVAAIAREISA